MPQQYRWGVGRSGAPPHTNRGGQGGLGDPMVSMWSGRPLAGEISGSHEADAWLETGFASRSDYSRKKCQSLDRRLKAQVSAFALSPYFGANGLTISRFSGGLDLPSTRAPLFIQTGPTWHQGPQNMGYTWAQIHILPSFNNNNILKYKIELHDRLSQN